MTAVEKPSIEKLPFPGVGIVYGMPAETYHRIDALNASALKELAKSARHLYVRMTTPFEPSDAMLLGTAVHTATLEPEKFDESFIIADTCSGVTGKGDRCNNIGKILSGGEWYCGVHGKKRTADKLPAHLDEDDNLITVPILTPAAMTKARAMAREIRNHDEARKILNSPTAQFEVSIFWTETITLRLPDGPKTIDVNCKARADIYDPDFARWGAVISDIKSCQCSQVEEFRNDIGQRHYHIQAAWYLRGAMLASGGIEHNHFIFLPIESPVTHLASVFPAKPGMIATGHNAIFEPAGLLEYYTFCKTFNRWPGYTDHEKMLPCDLPRWFYENEKRERSRDDRIL